MMILRASGNIVELTSAFNNKFSVYDGFQQNNDSRPKEIRSFVLAKFAVLLRGRIIQE